MCKYFLIDTSDYSLTGTCKLHYTLINAISIQFNFVELFVFTSKISNSVRKIIQYIDPLQTNKHVFENILPFSSSQ